MCILIFLTKRSKPFCVFDVIRWNLSASGARPNPQGSFRYGQINVTQQYVLKNQHPVIIDGKRRTTINGISYVNPDTPIKHADLYNLKNIYNLNFPTRPLRDPPILDSSVINGTYKGFMEVVFQNNDTRMQSYHLDGYAFFVVGYVLVISVILSFCEHSSDPLYL